MGIQATSDSNPFLKDVLIQVRHHVGETKFKAIEQLIEYEQEVGLSAYKWVITTGTVSEKINY